MALLRSSITFARIEWDRVRDTDADQRGRRSLGESLRQTERHSRRPLAVPPGELEGEVGESESTSDIPICDRLGRLLNHHCLDEIDNVRAEQMREILSKHGHAIFLAERVGVLEVQVVDRPVQGIALGLGCLGGLLVRLLLGLERTQPFLQRGLVADRRALCGLLQLSDGLAQCERCVALSFGALPVRRGRLHSGSAPGGEVHLPGLRTFLACIPPS